MSGVFAGFATITVIIAFGVLLGHLRVVDERGHRTLSTVAFFLASPALLFSVLQDSDLSRVFSGNLVAISAAVAATALVTLAAARWRRDDVGRTVIAMMCSSYCNAGNLGLPIAAYVLGDTALIAPVLLLQLLVLQPLALTALDVAAAPGRVSLRQVLTRPLRNPITVASMAGIAVAVAGVEVPAAVNDPIALLGGMAVPAMLLAYGVSLRLGPLPGRGVAPGELGLSVGLKLLAQPTVAYLVGLMLGLDQDALLAVTVISALPTAQNVFVIASRYGRAELLARDAIFVSTLGCVPVVVAIVALVA
ncbi:AEC family transporter [Nocardioides sp. cx-173]|uniref:AEC family transporter n=1 Tax=Nocardioides sp. cx-173 TaxID=2898796 RepID=UPI001E2F2311|nr:AEC family transporter [Nocardioides sp. cx-173]MCD4525269.1 AEC family transporter [Nocardioides sp. cx-173]UGB40929.1 AEC family transporter [Nocardioides sp. cx-173]